MEDTLRHAADRGECEEVYEVVKTAIIVKDGKTYRIEVEKCYTNQSIPYTTTCFVQEEINGKGLWVRYPLGWTARDDADSALAQAIGFLPQGQQAVGQG